MLLRLLPAQVATGQGGLAAVGAVMQGLLNEYSVPGAALAVTLQGRLAYARGYGYANTSSNTQAQPGTPFRQASISKTFTVIAIPQLVNQSTLASTIRRSANFRTFSPRPARSWIRAPRRSPFASASITPAVGIAASWATPFRKASKVPRGTARLCLAAQTGSFTPCGPSPLGSCGRISARRSIRTRPTATRVRRGFPHT